MKQMCVVIQLIQIHSSPDVMLGWSHPRLAQSLGSTESITYFPLEQSYAWTTAPLLSPSRYHDQLNHESMGCVLYAWAGPPGLSLSLQGCRERFFIAKRKNTDWMCFSGKSRRSHEEADTKQCGYVESDPGIQYPGQHHQIVLSLSRG